MCDLSGIDVVRMLKTDAQFARTPIIALTALALENEQRAARQAGLDEVITKPCLPDAVVRAAERMLAAKPGHTSSR